MRVYKFKSLRNFDHIADIFIKERFYAARLSELNDPMEGVVEYAKNVDSTFKSAFDKELFETRVCCFTKTRSNVLLWSHYADGFKGICIEVAIPDDEKEIRYNSFNLMRRIRQDNLEGFNLAGVAQLYCYDKMKEWRYEKEVRVFPMDNNVYVDRCLIDIKAVYLGLRISPVLKESLLKIVPDKIKIFETKLSEATGKVIQANRIR